MNKYSLYSSFVKPFKVSFDEVNEFRSVAIVEPIERGYGVTIGNCLRRALLSSIRGTCVSKVKIYGADHEFTVINGVLEDVANICLNLKSLAIKMDERDEFTFNSKFLGPKKIYATDLSLPDDITIINKDLYLFEITSNVEVCIDLTFKSGFGSFVIDPYTEKSGEIGEIKLNVNYSPVQNVFFKVENTVHNEFADYEKLFLDVKTNGVITPKESISLAAALVRDMLSSFVDFDEYILSSATSGKTGAVLTSSPLSGQINNEDVLSRPISDFEFSVRTWNCMQSMGIKYVGELVSKSEKDLLRRKNFGRKSLNEVKEVLLKCNLSLSKDDEDIESE